MKVRPNCWQCCGSWTNGSYRQRKWETPWVLESALKKQKHKAYQRCGGSWTNGRESWTSWPRWRRSCGTWKLRCCVFVLKSGLRILIWAPQVPFSVPPKTPKMGVFGYFGGTENGTWGARIKILRPLFNTNTPLKPPFRHFGNHFGPRKSDFWPFYFFWSFSHWNSHAFTNMHFPTSRSAQIKKKSKETHLKIQFYIEKHVWIFLDRCVHGTALLKRDSGAS